MPLIKCPECGHEVSDKAFSCPNCGNPINPLHSIETTDTGYQQEETIKRYADAIWAISKVFAALISVVTIILCLRGLFVDFSISLMVAVIGALIVFSLLAVGILAKAVLYIYANISINVHEINMKIK